MRSSSHTIRTIFIVGLFALIGLSLVATAGSLTPSALPSATMASLSDIWNSIASATYDSSAIVANQNGSLLSTLKYIEQNSVWASASNNAYYLGTGNVGIGTSTPETKLEVAGTASVSGNVYVAGSITSPMSGFGVSEKFGAGATVTGGGGTVFGNGATAGYFAAAFGVGSNAGYAGTAIGAAALDSTGFGFAAGNNAQAHGQGSIAIGGSAYANGSSAIAIGVAAESRFSASIILAASSCCAVTYHTSATNQFVVAPVNDVYFGNGVSSSAPLSFTLNATGGVGTNIAGGALRIAGGKATGSALGGSILFQTSDTGVSGATLQALTTKMAILANGNVGIGTAAPDAKLEVFGGNASVSNTFLVQSGVSVRALKTLSVQGSETITVPTSFTADGTTGAIQLAYDATNNKGVLRSVLAGTAFQPLYLQANEFRFSTGGPSISEKAVLNVSGNFGIGDFSPSEGRLVVGGAILASISGGEASGLNSQLYVTAAGNTFVSARDGTNHIETFLLSGTTGGVTGGFIGTVTAHNLYFDVGNSVRGAWTTAGNFGIGTTDVDEKFEVVGTASISGATTLRGVTYTWPSVQGGVSTYLQNNGSGTLTWETVSAGTSVASDGLDFDEFTNSMTLDANTTVASAGYALDLNDILLTAGTILPDMAGAIGTQSLFTLGDSSHWYSDIYAESLHLGANSLYLNGTKVLSQAGNVMEFTADPNQSLSVQTFGTGNLIFDSVGTGNIQILADKTIEALAKTGITMTVPADNPGYNMNFTNQSLGGSILFSATGGSGAVTFNAPTINFVGGTNVSVLDTTRYLRAGSSLIATTMLQVGGTATASYSRFGTGTTTHALSTSADALFSGIFEVDGQAFFDGSASISGRLEVVGVASLSQLYVAGSLYAPASGVTSNSLDFDEYVDVMTLDANLTVASAGYTTTWYSWMGIGAAPTANVVLTLGARDNITEIQGAPTGALNIYAGSGRALYLGGNANATVGITSTGRVGVGDLTPETTFEVVGIASVSTLYAGAGSAAVPSITLGDDPDTGIYWHSSGRIGITGNGGAALLTNTQGIGVRNGTVSVPGVANFNDSDTGIYWPGDGKFAITIDGVERFRVTSSGFIGIGDLTPETNFEVAGTASVSQLLVGGVAHRSVTSNSLDFDELVDAMTVDAATTINSNAGLSFTKASISNVLEMPAGAYASLSGTLWVSSVADSRKVGINTSSPAARLTVNGGSVISAISGFSTGLNSLLTLADPNIGLGFGYEGAGATAFIQPYSISGVSAKNLILNPYGANVGIGVTTPEQRLEVGGSIIASAAASVGLTLNNLNEDDARFIIQSTGTAGSTARLDFLGSASQAFMTVASSGNVGIGTTGPLSELQVMQRADGPNFGTGVPTTGLRVNGYDDRAGQYLNLSVDQNGLGVIGGTVGTIYFAPENTLAVGFSTVGISIAVDKQVLFGTTTNDNARMEWDTAQTSDALMIGVNDNVAGSTQSRTVIVSDVNDMSFNFAHAEQGSPTLFIHSASQTTDEWASFTHDGVNAVFGTGEGAYLFPNGNVGIGTTNPGAKFEVNGVIKNNSFINSGNAYQIGGQSVAGASGTNLQYGAGSYYQSLGLFTNGLEKLHIDASGNVGIGSIAPEQKLEVSGNILASASAASVGLILNNLSEDDAQFSIQSVGTSGSTARLDFLGSASQAFMTIASSGFIGINKTSPVAPLDVTGGIRASTFLLAGNGYLYSNTPANAANSMFTFLSNTGQRTSTGGNNYFLNISPSYNQTSGAAANTDLLINRTETAVGSGVQNLIDAQVGGVSRFSVNNAGQVTTASNVLSGGYVRTQFLRSSGSTTSESKMTISGGTSSGGNDSPTTKISLGAGTSTNTTGQTVSVVIDPTYDQSGGTGVTNTDLLINRTETSLGTTPGVQYLFDAQVGGISKFSIFNDGNASVSGVFESNSDVVAGNVFRVGAAFGVTQSCGGSQYLGGIAVVGGIVTGGTCTDDDIGTADLAENFFAAESGLRPGMLVSAFASGGLDFGVTGSLSKYQQGVVRAVSGNAASVIGVISTDAEMVLAKNIASGSTGEAVPVALAGRVPVLVTTLNGSIKVGDHIVASAIPGVGMKATRAGMTVGIALEPTEEGLASDSFGSVIVLMSPAYWAPSFEGEVATQADADSEGGIASVVSPMLSKMFAGIVGMFEHSMNMVFESGLIKTVRGMFSEVQTDKLCVGAICVTESQLQQLLNAQGISPAGTSISSPSVTPTPDVFEDEALGIPDPTPAPTPGSLSDELLLPDAPLQVIPDPAPSLTPVPTSDATPLP